MRITAFESHGTNVEPASLILRLALLAMLGAANAAQARQVCGQDPGSPRWCAEVPDERPTTPRTANPDTTRARANAVNEQGRDALAAGRYEEALRLFAQAYAIDPQPIFEKNRKLAAISIAARAAASRNDYSREAALWDEANTLFPDGYYRQQRDRARRDAENRLLDRSVTDVEQQINAADASISNATTLPEQGAARRKPLATFDDRTDATQDARVRVRQRIGELQSAYERILRSVAADARIDAEWLEASKHASGDAYKSAIDLALLHAAEKAKDDLRNAQKELWSAETALINAVSPDRRSQLHSAVGALANRRDEIRRELDALEGGQRMLGIVDLAESKSKAEVIWAIADQFGALPPIATLAKMVADAAYDVHVQLLSVNQVVAINARSEAYLKAVATLDKRMKTLVAEEKRLK